MLTNNSNKTFPAFFYWLRLPAAAASGGICGGISTAKLCLNLYTPPIATFYINILFLTTIFSALAGILCRRPFVRAAAFFLSGAALFTYTEAALCSFYENMEQISERNQILTLKVTITTPVITSPYSTARFRCKVIGADNKEVERALKNKTLRCSSRGPVPPAGTVTVQGRYNAPQKARGPQSFNEREYYAVNNMHGNFQISRILPESAPPPPHLALFSHSVRTQVHTVINKVKSEEARGILHAAFLAENEYRSRSLDAVFKKAGIAHLLAISGFHAALLLTAITTTLKFCGVPNRPRMIASIGALWCYLFFIGFIPSLFRVTVMVTFFCLSTLLQRRNHSIHSLCAAGLFWLYISPHSLFAAGFQLSFAATAGIILLHPVLCTVTPKLRDIRADFLLRKTITPFWLSAATSAATLPILLHHFGTFSVYGLFFNLAAIPLMAAAMWFFFAALVLSPIAPLCGLSVWGTEKILGIIILLSKFSERFKLSEITAPDVSWLPLFIMSIFMFGLCAARADLRKLFLLRAGGAAVFLTAVVTLHSSTQTKVMNSEFKSPYAKVNVILYPQAEAWITANGESGEIRKMREREIEPFLRRKKVSAVPLFIINEEAQKEAHEFMFSTGFNPQIVVLRDEHLSGGDDNLSVYKKLDLKYLINTNGLCSLKIDNGKAEIK